MLDRYRKSGGFVQLLNLLETCGPAKQEKFLQIVREEDAAWADAITQKMISIDRIFSWPEETLAEIAGNLQELTIVIAMHGMEPAQRESFTRTFSHAVKRRIQESFDASKPTAAEVSAMMMKIVTETRKMMTEGRLRMDKIDADLVIESDIEEMLKKGALRIVPRADVTLDVSAVADVVGAEVASMAAGDSASKEELLVLRKKVIALSAENGNLKAEVSRLRTKLDEVKKLVA